MSTVLERHEKEIKELQSNTNMLKDSVVEIREMKDTLKDILEAIKGSELSGNKGIVKRLDSLEVRMVRQEKFKDRFWIYFSIVTSIVFGIFTFLTPIIQKILIDRFDK